MTYHQKPTTLIARSGYGSPQHPLAPMATGLGSGDYMLAPGARLYIGPHGQPEESLGGIFDSVTSFFKGAGKSVVDFYGQGQQAKGAAAALQAQQAGGGGGGGMPSWLLPVALVGGGVVLVLLLKRPQPQKNPARGHRRRRRARRRNR